METKRIRFPNLFLGFVRVPEFYGSLNEFRVCVFRNVFIALRTRTFREVLEQWEEYRVEIFCLNDQFECLLFSLSVTLLNLRIDRLVDQGSNEESKNSRLYFTWTDSILNGIISRKICIEREILIEDCVDRPERNTIFPPSQMSINNSFSFE